MANEKKFKVALARKIRIARTKTKAIFCCPIVTRLKPPESDDEDEKQESAKKGDGKAKKSGGLESDP